MKPIYEEILGNIAGMPVTDTHEHLESEGARIARKLDMFNTLLLHYASCDLVSAGMSDDDIGFLKGESEDLEKKWALFAPFWAKARNTAYCRALVRAVKLVYGIGDINEGTYKDIDARMKAENKKGIYKRVLKDLCNIERSIQDRGPDESCDELFFVTAFNTDGFIRFNSRDAITSSEKKFNVSINKLSDWTELIRKTIEVHMRSEGTVCLKSALAYQRSIRYDRTAYCDADRIFTRILTAKGFTGWYSHSPADFPTKALEDYLMHFTIQTAAELGLPIQFHTGLQEGNGNFITNSNPVNLTNLFMEYPNARFDIFHAGYPYGGELCALAKNFRNVYVDLCWMNIISQEYSVRFIEELLETVPSNKIFGFGGDYCFVEGVPAHLEMARENLARALTNKVEKGYLSMSESLSIARRILYDNAKEFFRI